MRYIQASISDKDHRKFEKFAFNHSPKLSLGQLIETAVKKYMAVYNIRQKEINILHNQQPLTKKE